MSNVGDSTPYRPLIVLSKVLEELCSIVATYIAHHFNSKDLMGAPLRGGRFWLEFEYPEGPPPEFHRVG